MTFRSIVSLLFFFLMCSHSVLFSQDKEVRSIEIIGSKKISIEKIKKMINTKEGKGTKFNALVWIKDQAKLIESGLFKSAVGSFDANRKFFVRLVLTVEENDFDPTVKSIEIKGLKKIKKETILASLNTVVGKVFDKEIYNRDLEQLYKQGFSIDIKSSVEKKIDGVYITIELAEDRDWFDNYKVNVSGGSSGSLRKHLKDQIFRSGTSFYMDDGEIKSIKNRIREYYKEKSHFFAEVNTATVLERGLKKIIFIVTKGPKLRVGGLEYIGNKRYNQHHLIKYARVDVRPLGKYWRKTKFDQSLFVDDRVKLIRYYNKNGYIDAKIEVDPFEYNSSKDRIYITFNIHEGPRYIISKVNFKGNDLFTDEDLLSTLKNFPGSPYYPRDIFLEDSKAIATLYGNEGRLFTLVFPDIKIDTDRHLVEITYEIKEKGKIKLGRVHLKGNDVTRENVFLRELELFPGDDYDAFKFDQSKRKIQRLPFISKDPRKFKFEMIPSGENTGDLIIEVEEEQSGNIQFGAAFNEIDSAVGTVSVSERNFNWMSLMGIGHFKGGGQNLSLSASAGVESQRYAVSFNNPKIFDRQISFGLSSYLRRRDFSEFDERRLGGGFGLGKQLFGDLWVNLRYRLERIEIDEVDDDAPQLILDEEGEYLVSALTLNLRYDKRNSGLFPTSGYFLRLSETLGESFAIGDKDFTQTKFEFKGYLPVFYRVDEDTKRRYPYYFATRFEIAANFSYNDSVVPLSDRFFTGGPTSVRGFEPNELGPKDNGKVFPGNFRALGNLEFNMPVVDQVIYLAFFVDSGYVWEDVQDFEVDELRVSAGITIRIRIPQLSNQPISLNYAFPLINEEDDDIERFSFNFVTAF